MEIEKVKKRGWKMLLCVLLVFTSLTTFVNCANISVFLGVVSGVSAVMAAIASYILIGKWSKITYK